jgi:hypothetical protein
MAKPETDALVLVEIKRGEQQSDFLEYDSL